MSLLNSTSDLFSSFPSLLKRSWMSFRLLTSELPLLHVASVCFCHAKGGDKLWEGVDSWVTAERGKRGGRGGGKSKCPRSRRVALITGSSWVIVCVTKSNQVEGLRSRGDTSEQQLETLIRRSFVDEKPVGKTKTSGSASWSDMLWEEAQLIDVL